MECNNLEDPLIRLKNCVKSNVRIGRPQSRKSNNSCNSSNTVGHNTNPIICAVCGSTEYTTLHLEDNSNYFFGPILGCNSSGLPKKNMLSAEFAQTCGALSPLTQTIFPQLSLYHLPSDLYYSHYNANVRFPSNQRKPIDKHCGVGNPELDANQWKAQTVNSDSTCYRENRHSEKKKYNNKKLNRDMSFCKKEANTFRKEENLPNTANANLSEIRSLPLSMVPPWMGNMCPFFPYMYASLAFPLNQPFIPIYFPVPGKWQNSDIPQDEESTDCSVPNTPTGDADSLNQEGKKKFELKIDKNASEYDFKVLARELMLEQKSNYDEDEDVEINLDEITSCLKIPDVNSEREMKSEKISSSKEELVDHGKGCQENNEVQSSRLSSQVQDNFVRTLSDENLWYKAQDCGKTNWRSFKEYDSKNIKFASSSNYKINELEVESGERERIGDGVFHDSSNVWTKDEYSAKEPEVKNRSWPKNDNQVSRKTKVTFGDLTEIRSITSDKKNEWSALSKSDSSDEMELSEEKINSLLDSARLRDLKIINEQDSKTDQFNVLTEDNETSLDREKFKTDTKSNGVTHNTSPLNNSNNSKLKKDEKSKSLELTLSKYESLKIPISNSRKCRKEDLKKRWHI